MRCYLEDICYDFLKIGSNVIIFYGTFFACYGKGQEHLPITVDDGVYIGMRASIISKNIKNHRGYIYIPMQWFGHVRWSTRIFQKAQQLLEYRAELFLLQII